MRSLLEAGLRLLSSERQFTVDRSCLHARAHVQGSAGTTRECSACSSKLGHVRKQASSKRRSRHVGQSQGMSGPILAQMCNSPGADVGRTAAVASPRRGQHPAPRTTARRATTSIAPKDCPSARTRWVLWTVSPLVPVPLSSLFVLTELRCAAPAITQITPWAAVGSLFMQPTVLRAPSLAFSECHGTPRASGVSQLGSAGEAAAPRHGPQR